MHVNKWTWFGLLGVGLLTGIVDADEFAGEAEEEQALREKLTEREDENRNPNPFTVDLLGRPLMFNAQYEIAMDDIDRLSLVTPGQRARDDAPDDDDDDDDDDGITAPPLRDLPGQTLLEQEFELEMFYPYRRAFSLFGQARVIQEKDLDSDTMDAVSDSYVERGEMWLYSEEPFGVPLSFEFGRLDFEDDRLWWWDEDLDAVRVIYETESFEIGLAAARELAPRRSDRGSIDPEQDDVNRLFAEVSWDWSEEHALELFALHHQDRSPTPAIGHSLDREREDESDAALTWLGLRASGALEFGNGGLAGYWLDGGWVDGRETVIASEDLPGERIEIVDRFSQHVEGWGFDVGVTCLLPVTAEPRFTLGYARGSGDATPEDGRDRNFRQTELHGNEPGFGGVQRFQGYGELLDPELSNLSVFTAGIGWSLFDSSSIDLVFHDFQLVEQADSLRNARIDTELTGVHNDLGYEIDLILGIEEWERFEVEASMAAFRAGKAFGVAEGEWICTAFLAMRYAF